jgi:hypothetical protein
VRAGTCNGQNVSRNKHLEQLLLNTVLPITLIKHAQQDAEPQNKNQSSGPKNKPMLSGGLFERHILIP